MTITINVNSLSLCHKGSGGFVHNTLPDVCKTPGQAVPIPYQNEAYSKDLIKGTTRCQADGGNMIANFGSQFSRSVFDEPGSMGGVVSGTNKAEAEWITHSFDVFFEKRAACRLTDKMFMNHRNTVSLGGEQQPTLSDDEFVQMICKLACDCFLSLQGKLKQGETYQDCLNNKLVEQFYDGRYPKPDSPIWREVPFDRGNGWSMIERTAGDGLPTSGYIRPNSRRLDIARVQDGKIQKIYDVKFRGDTIEGPRRREYQDIAKRHTGSKDNYDEFDVDDNCDNCGQPPSAPAPVTETQEQTQSSPSVGDWFLLGGLGLTTIGLALFPFDGPAGEMAAGTGFAAQAGRMGLSLL
jgi:hypothetical protein